MNQPTLEGFHVFELQTAANKFFKPEKIREYLKILKLSDGGMDACHVTVHYILVVQGKMFEQSSPGLSPCPNRSPS